MRFRIFPIFFILTLYSEFTYCQKDSSNAEEKLVLSLSVGAALPLFNFNEYEINSEESKSNFEGAAKPGFNGKLNLNWFIFGNTGLSIDLGASYNKAKEPDSAALYYNAEWNTYYHGLGGGNGITSYEYETDYWLTGSFMIGFTGRKLYPHHAFGYKFSAGILAARSPGTTLTEQTYSWAMNHNPSQGERTLTQPAIIGYGPGCDAHIDWQFPFGKGKKFSALVSVDYITSHNTFKEKKSVEDNLPYYKVYEYNFSKNINQLLINFGIVYSIK